jgi:hypothetical protein
MKVAARFAKALETEGVRGTPCMPKPDLAPLLPRGDAHDAIRGKQAETAYANHGMVFGQPVFARSIEANDLRDHRGGSIDQYPLTSQRTIDADTRPTIEYSNNQRVLNTKVRLPNAAG